MYTVAYGSVGTYTVLQASDIVETWTDENTLLEKVFNNDRDAYETAKSSLWRPVWPFQSLEVMPLLWGMGRQISLLKQAR